MINNPIFNDRAEIIREKGTNRARFFRGQVDKYTWVDRGDSYLPSEMNAAYLWAQLLKADEITQNRMDTWNAYRAALEPLETKGRIELQIIPDGCLHNAHMFYLKLRDLEDRTRFITFMRKKNIGCVFHYVPLHSAPAGLKFGSFNGDDEYTTSESDKLVRLPLYYGLTEEDRMFVINSALSFFVE